VAGAGDLALRGHEGTIVHPDSGHFVHENEGSFECAVDLLVHGIRGYLSAHLLPAGPQIIVPDLVATGELLQGSLIDQINTIIRGLGLVVYVAQPMFYGVGVPQDFLLIRYILLFLWV